MFADGLEGEAQRALRAACQTLGIEVAPAEERSGELLLAGLQVGERQVPVEVAERLAGSGGGAQVVLLAGEPLVRGHVVLGNGRIHLLAPPHDSDKLAARLRNVVEGRAPAGGDAVPYRSELFRMVERWSSDYWASILGASPQTPADEIGKLQLVEKRSDGCFLVFPTESTRRRPDDLVALLERLMLGDDRSLWQWLSDLSGRGAVLAYDVEARDLIVDLPAGDECVAFLLSSQRLPHVSPLPTGKSFCMAAAPGDLLLAAIGEEAVKLLDAETVRSIVKVGAAVGASELKQRFRAMATSNAILLLEARA